MLWFKQIGRYEFLIIAIFIGLYLAYAIRTWIMARRLRSGVNLFWVKFILRTIFFSMLIISLLGPSFGGLKKEVKAVGKDIIFALDLSQSINCTDVQPSRLEKVKFELKKVLESFTADRVALVVFSDESYLYCPFTFDKGALNTLLETANSRVISSEGTDFGKALDMAHKKFMEMETSSKKVSSKLVLLVSDGEDFGDETDDAIAQLEKDGIRVFTLGVGTEEGGSIPTATGGKLLDEDGNTVIARLKPDDLRAIARETNGRYFELSNNRNEVPALIDAIQAMEGEVRDVQMVDVGANKYFYFLFVALAVLVIDVLFTINIIRL
jgi:Ca-activated chloride channel family protein